MRNRARPESMFDRLSAAGMPAAAGLVGFAEQQCSRLTWLYWPEPQMLVL